MKKKISFITLLYALFITGLVTSCQDNKVLFEPEEMSYVDIDYCLSCSEDLLQYVTPHVTFTDEDGITKTIEIQDSEWEEDEETEFSVRFVDKAKVMKWTKNIRYTDIPVDEEMSVVYIPKKDMPLYTKTNVNKFYHYLSATMTDFADEKDGVFHAFSSKKPYNKTWIVRNNLEELISIYIDGLDLPYIQQEDNRSCIIIGAKNNVITDIVSGYKDKQGVLVNNDGTFSIKYEDDPYVAPKSYTDIAYMLNCSEEMLRYTIPQVTYTDASGKTVTFQLDESDFEINENLTKWASHIHADAQRTFEDGEENAKIMKWTKHVHYDDISVVDDEMTVTYVPQENIGQMRLSHAFHELSAGFLLLNDSGVRTIQPANRTNSNIVEGEKQVVWQYIYLDSSGIPFFHTWSVDSFIGDDEIKFIDSNGTPVTIKLSDFIINSYKDHQGFHLESNGSYSLK